MHCCAEGYQKETWVYNKKVHTRYLYWLWITLLQGLLKWKCHYYINFNQTLHNLHEPKGENCRTFTQVTGDAKHLPFVGIACSVSCYFIFLWHKYGAELWMRYPHEYCLCNHHAQQFGKIWEKREMILRVVNNKMCCR